MQRTNFPLGINKSVFLFFIFFISPFQCTTHSAEHKIRTNSHCNLSSPFYLQYKSLLPYSLENPQNQFNIKKQTSEHSGVKEYTSKLPNLLHPHDEELRMTKAVMLVYGG